MSCQALEALENHDFPGFGFADAHAEKSATASTAYHPASLTMTFAATIVMQFVEEDLLDLDAPISRWKIELPGADAIRVRHLLTHTSEDVPGAACRYNGNRAPPRIAPRSAGPPRRHP